MNIVSSVWPQLWSIKRNSGPADLIKASHVLQGPHPYSAMRGHYPHQDIQRCTIAQHDVVPYKDSSAPEVVDFPYVGGMIADCRFSSDEDLSRITLCIELLISGKNTLLFLVCTRMVCSAPRQTNFLVRYVQRETDHWTAGVCVQFGWKILFQTKHQGHERKICSLCL